MITVEFTFTEALEILYDNNFKNKDRDEQLIGIATNELLRRHQFVSFVKNYNTNILRTMTVHSDKHITPGLEHTVTTEDFKKPWFLYYTREALITDINRLSNVKVETE